MARDAVKPDAPARRGGRPTREEAARRDLRLLEVATRLFMERGFDGTSLDAVAEEAGVGKPTLYGRYRDKGELFEAVLKDRMNEWLVPISQAAEELEKEAGSADLETVLHELSLTMLQRASLPGAAALHRAFAAHALRFPEMAQRAHEQGWVRAVQAVASILRGFAARGAIQVPDPVLAAELFLNMVLGPASRATIYGIESDATQIEERRAAAVNLFVKGIVSP